MYKGSVKGSVRPDKKIAVILVIGFPIYFPILWFKNLFLYMSMFIKNSFYF